MAIAAMVALGLMAMATSAYAVEHHPTGEFAPFADCPLSNPAASNCLVAKTEGGKFVIGKETVPITNPITLQGGIEGFGSGEEKVIAAEDGNTLTKSPQKVPGGLAGLVKCNEISNFLERIACELIFENSVTGVNATTELAAPASSIGLHTFRLIGAFGTALSLPVKVHLENPFLGSNCYIGSNTHPVVIEFTTGTTSPPEPNKPIKGNPGTFAFNEAETLLTVSGNELVNNSFAAPEVEGCGGSFSFLIDPIVDSKLGLPSAAGHNTAILQGTLKVAAAEAVKASE
ncbi:MAG TPA: hypothetical protein VGX69_06065 [Solirubrobacteraceae bacterium]|jgi:hypothetical protein|nr:hypothetical protein [Solirubrobacteraceae bacterium]